MIKNKSEMSSAHEFVEYIPEELREGVVYISIPFATAVHMCFCGCGSRVVTPISPTDWQLTFDGKTVSLHPSIGSWSLKCQSHYWIRKNRVQWASRWSREEIEEGREDDREAKQLYFSTGTTVKVLKAAAEGNKKSKSIKKLWKKLRASK
jgi:hypothetical protein